MNLDQIPNLAPNVAIVAIFVWYLIKRDVILQDIVRELGKRLDKLADVIVSLEKKMASIERDRIEEKKAEE